MTNTLNDLLLPFTLSVVHYITYMIVKSEALNMRVCNLIVTQNLEWLTIA